MTVTPDVIGVIAAVFVAAVGFFAGMSAMLRRQLEGLEHRIDARFEHVDRRFEQVEKQFEQVEKQIKRVAADMSELRADLLEVKINGARLEGLPPRLVMPR